MLMSAIASVAFPVFVSVTVCPVLVDPTVRLVKVRLEGESDPDAEVPVPERETDCGLPVAVSAIANEAERLPLVLGVNVTLTVQLELAASELPQLLVWAKSAESEPRIAILEIVSEALPGFESVIVWLPLVLLTA
jgi:hypothetical protein